jgi:2-iminobutanoate/2-iminopropanoate deaminase
MTAKRALHTDHAPKAIGPYSQAVEAGGFLFVSGQIPLDPKTGELVAGDVKLQTERVLKNLEAVLAAADLTLENVVKTTIFLKSMSDFAAVNEVYGLFFKKPYPARATVEVSALPKGASVEIEAIAEL